MSTPLLIDTHVLLWLFEDRSPLPPQIKNEIEHSATEGNLWISAISMWEIAMLAHKKRITLALPVKQWIKDALAIWHCQMIKLDVDIAVEAYAMPGDFHGDPADRMIVATAHLNDLVLVTADKLIQQYAENQHIQLKSI